jgi:hypothetical protein
LGLTVGVHYNTMDLIDGDWGRRLQSDCTLFTRRIESRPKVALCILDVSMLEMFVRCVCAFDGSRRLKKGDQQLENLILPRLDKRFV